MVNSNPDLNPPPAREIPTGPPSAHPGRPGC
jgi:hypothetical protein